MHYCIYVRNWLMHDKGSEVKIWQLGSWRPQGAHGVNSSLSPKAENWCPSSKTGRQREQALPCSACKNWLRPTHIGRAFCVPQSPITHTFMSSRNTLANPPRITFHQLSGTPWPRQVDTEYSLSRGLFTVLWQSWFYTPSPHKIHQLCFYT